MPTVKPADLHQFSKKTSDNSGLPKLTFCLTACFTAPSAPVTPSLCSAIWMNTSANLLEHFVCACVCTHGGQHG